MRVEIELIKAFTKDKKHGNPAGVIYDADTLSDQQMLFISASLGFSESAFVQKSYNADYQLRFFTTTKEVDFCGHATIAAFYSLLKNQFINISPKKNSRITEQTKAGLLSVELADDNKIMMSQKNPEFGYIENDRTKIADLLGLNRSDIGSTPIQSVSTAVQKLIIPIKSLNKINQAVPNLPRIAGYCQQNSVKGFYLFTDSRDQEKVDFYTRFFNPLDGVNEDPATGVAAGALACYTDKYVTKNSKDQYIISQGYLLGKDSLIYTDTSDGIKVGGHAIKFGHKHFDL